MHNLVIVRAADVSGRGPSSTCGRVVLEMSWDDTDWEDFDRLLVEYKARGQAFYPAPAVGQAFYPSPPPDPFGYVHTAVSFMFLCIELGPCKAKEYENEGVSCKKNETIDGKSSPSSTEVVTTYQTYERKPFPIFIFLILLVLQSIFFVLLLEDAKVIRYA